jgi:hypothetical protein
VLFAIKPLDSNDLALTARASLPPLLSNDLE